MAFATFFLAFSLVLSRSSNGDLPRIGIGKLPAHAIQVLGDDRFVFPASEVFFHDAENVVAISGPNAARFEVKTGQREEIETNLGSRPGRGVLMRGGNRWLFGTKWEDELSLITVLDLTFEQPQLKVPIAGKKRALALSDDGKFLAVLETKYNDLHIDIVGVHDARTTDTIPSPNYHSGNSQDNPRAWFARSGRVLVVSHRLTKQNRDRRYRFFHFNKDGKIGEVIAE